MKIIFTLVLLSVFALNLSAQSSTKSTSFWLAYMENISLLFNDTPQFAIVISADDASDGLISVPATGLEIPFSVDANSVTEIILPNAVWYSQVTEVIENKGILIESDLPIEAHAIHYRSYFSDGTRLLPASMLSSSYTVMAVGDYNNSSPSSLVIVATEDNTEVAITPSVLTQGLRPPGITFTITLNKGQIYQILASSDLTGTRIASNNGSALAVFAGAQQADVYCQGDDSHLWEQLLPEEEWGTEYMLVPYLGMSGDVFKILAAENNTVLSLDCEELVTLNEGESHELFVNSLQRLVSNLPIEVAQLNTGQNCNASPGGPSFMIIPSLNKQSNLYRWEAPSTTNYFTQHVTHVVARTENIDEVLLDGNTISFQNATAYPGYSFARVEVNAGVHILSGESPFWAVAAGFGEADAYTFSLGWTLDIPIGLVQLEAIPGATGSEFCPGEEIFFAYDFQEELSSEFWDFDNGQTGSGSSPSMTFDLPGIYQVQFQGSDDQDCPYLGTLELEILDCGSNEVSNLKEDGFEVYTHNNELTLINHTSINQLDLNLFDTSGKLVWAKNISGKNFKKSFPELNAGLYILHIKSSSYNKSARLVFE